MLSSDLDVVSLDSIPSAPYVTPVDNIPLLYSTAKRMEAICVNRNGMGLAAAQVGLPWRLFVAMLSWPDSNVFSFLFDCEYEPIGDERFSSLEGCLSLPGGRYKVSRHSKVRVNGFRIVEGCDGFFAERFSEIFEGVAAVLVQHEIDHDHGRNRMIDTIGTKMVMA